MAALGPKARAVVEAGRSALRPGAGDRARIESALRAELGPAALPASGSVAPAPVTAAAGWKGALGVAVGVGLVGAGVYLASRLEIGRAPQASVSPSAVAPIAPELDRPTEPVVGAPREVAPPSQPSREPPSGSITTTPIVDIAPGSRSTPAPRERDRLAEEVELLSRATTSLRAGRAAEALKALDEHQSKFPRGALSEERRAAKAQALCSLGRIEEGRVELRRLAPQSPAAARAKQACEAGPRE